MRTTPIPQEKIYDYTGEIGNNVIGKRIVQARKAKKYSLVAFSKVLEAQGLKISSPAINKWELGMSIPSAYQLLLVSRVLDIEDGLAYFCSDAPRPELNAQGQMKLEEYRELLIASGKYRPRDESGIVYIDMPVSCLTASAGTGAFLDEGNYEMVSFPVTAVPKGAEFGLRVSGESMEPVYHDGQIVWVQQCAALRCGEVGIFIYDGEGYIKVYSEQPPEEAESFTDSYGAVHAQPVMLSYNKAYAPRLISPSANFQIVGRVL